VLTAPRGRLVTGGEMTRTGERARDDAASGIWSFALSSLTGLVTLVVLLVAVFAPVPPVVAAALVALVACALVAAVVLDTVEAVREGNGAGAAWRAGVSAPFRFLLGWLGWLW
jgi:xanthosine utilization system XapX-like protein